MDSDEANIYAYIYLSAIVIYGISGKLLFILFKININENKITPIFYARNATYLNLT